VKTNGITLPWKISLVISRKYIYDNSKKTFKEMEQLIDEYIYFFNYEMI